jgi:hypothetical protein
MLGPAAVRAPIASVAAVATLIPVSVVAIASVAITTVTEVAVAIRPGRTALELLVLLFDVVK